MSTVSHCEVQAFLSATSAKAFLDGNGAVQKMLQH